MMNVVNGIIFLIGIIYLVFPALVKNIMIIYTQFQYNLVKNIPVLNIILVFGLEKAKFASLVSIRLTGLSLIVFIIFTAWVLH